MQENPTQMLPDDDQHEAFMRLFLENEHEVLRYVLALVPNLADARDIVQETAVSLWKRFDAYDPEQPFAPWACRFALNKIRHHWRREQRKQKLFEADTLEFLAARRAERADELDYRRDHLKDCPGKIPDKSRAIITGYYFREQTVEQLSDQTGRTVEAIYKALQRIRKGLLKCIETRLESDGAAAQT